jgi:hypothetical protein
MPRAHGPSASAQSPDHAERVRAYAARIEAGLPLFEDGPVDVPLNKVAKRRRRVAAAAARPAADTAAAPGELSQPARDMSAPPP